MINKKKKVSSRPGLLQPGPESLFNKAENCLK
jgi:hypothetical protein